MSDSVQSPLPAVEEAGPQPPPRLPARSRWVRRFIVPAGCLVAAAILAVWGWPWLRVGWHLRAARNALGRGDVAAALAPLHAADRIRSDSAEIQYLLAVAHRRRGDLGEFGDRLRRAAELGSPEEDIQRQRWLASVQVGQVQSLPSRVKEAEARGLPDEMAEEIYEAAARGYLAAHRLRDAWASLGLWLQWRPESPSARFLRGQLYEKLGNPAKAVEDYRAAVASLPADCRVRVKLGQALLQLNQVEEAREEFRASLDLSPYDADALLGMAQCARQLGDDAEARRALQSALAEELSGERRAVALAEVGCILLREKQVQEAIGALDEAAESAPGDPSIHDVLALALAGVGQGERARYHQEQARQLRAQQERMGKIKRALDDAPDNADLRCELGSILIEQGLAKEAADWLRTALDCDPRHRRSHELLGQYYAEAGNRALAAHHRWMAAQAPPRQPPAERK